MKTTLYILALPFLLFACKKTDSISEIKPVVEKSDIPADTVKPPKPKRELTKLDSISIANDESVRSAGNNLNKAFVYLKDGDSTIRLTANIRMDHRIFFYSQPDTKSEPLLLLSVFTNDVENNPFGLKLGAFYQTSGMENLTLKYNSTTGKFVKAYAIDNTNKSTPIYFEKKWIEFE